VPGVGWVKPQSDQRLSDHVALGVPTRSFSLALVDAAVEAAGRTEQRLVAARAVVYYVLALFFDASYEEVMRNLLEGLSYQTGWTTQLDIPTKGAISQARARLDAGPLNACFERACVQVATEATRGRSTVVCGSWPSTGRTSTFLIPWPTTRRSAARTQLESRGSVHD